MSRAAIFMLMYGLALAGCYAEPLRHATKKPIETTVCELARSGKHLDGTLVQLRAVSITDLRHGSMLKDHRCPSDFVDVLIASGSENDPEIKSFSDAILRDARKGGLRIFNVDLSGKFHWNGKSGVIEVNHIARFEKNSDWMQQ